MPNSKFSEAKNFIRHWVDEFNHYRPNFAILARTTTFRVALSFAGFFLGFALLLLGYVYFSTIGLLTIDADKAARRELNDLVQTWKSKGVDQLNMTIIERASAVSDNLYVLLTPEGFVLSGNIDAIPMDLSKVERPIGRDAIDKLQIYSTDFRYYRADSESQQRRARGVFLAGTDGYGLFVARDLGSGYVLAERVAKALWAGSLAVLAFAVIGGYLAARGASRRVDELSKTARSVMGGDLSRRAPTRVYEIGQGDEFDALTEDLNAMLERTERLVQSSRTIGDSIAHDLRSPLTRLRANLENAQIEAKDEEELRDAIDNAIYGLDNVVGTFNAVLRLSRLEAGQGANFEKFDLTECLYEIGELFEPSIDEKGLKFETKIQKDLQINGDKSLLIQAITNLIDNAIKYTPNGKIILSAAKAKSNIEIKICDSGLGILPQDRQRALKRFVRLDSARTKDGSGIGLSLAQAICEVHHGSLELSDGLKNETGIGLCANINLPC